MSGPVQTASNNATSGTSVTVTLGSATTAGNCLVAYIGTADNSANPTVSGITLGGAAGNWAKARQVPDQVNADCEIWTDQDCAGGQTSVVVTFSAGTGGTSLIVRVEEWAGILTSAAVDAANSADGNAATTQSSGSTGTLAQADEVVLGCVAAGGTPAGPSSPWTNQAVVTTANLLSLITGWQVVSATAAQTYTTTTGSSTIYGAVIISLKETAAAAAGAVQPRATVPVPRRRPARGQWQHAAGQAYAAVPAPAQQPAPARRRVPARAVWRGIAGQAFVQVPAPRQQPAPAPRRRPARAVVRFIPVTTANAAPVTPPAGAVQPRATVVTTRRRPSRAVTPVSPGPFVPLVPAAAEGGAVYYPYHHRGRGRTR